MTVQRGFNLGFDCVQTLAAVDDGISFRLFGSTLQIHFPHPIEKLDCFLFKAVFLACLVDARHRYFQRHIQQQGQIGTEITLHPMLERGNILQGNAAPAALIGKRCIGKAVRNDMRAVFQGRQK